LTLGVDLDGNKYWEVRESYAQATKLRRTAEYSPNVHHSDVNVPPQWMQWLRHTREVAPTVEEQQHDVIRQQQLRQLADAADARWAAQPSFLQAPDARELGGSQARSVSKEGEQLDELAQRFGISNKPDAMTAADITPANAETGSSGHDARATRQSGETAQAKQRSPWDSASKTKDEPDSWSPTAAKR
jgi:NADH dehydrogenase [ubiquinone] 1 alpha subcomplex assembly factor 2